PLFGSRRGQLAGRAGGGAGERIERASDLPDVDQARAGDVLDVAGVRDPLALDGRRVRRRVVLMEGRGRDDEVVMAVVEGGDPLRAGGDLPEGAPGPLLADVDDGVARVPAPEAVLEECPHRPGKRNPQVATVPGPVVGRAEALIELDCRLLGGR